LSKCVIPDDKYLVDAPSVHIVGDAMVNSPPAIASYVDLCQRSAVGKRLPEALYVHLSALPALHPTLQALQQSVERANLIKFSFRQPQIIYLFYPDFDTQAHPALHGSIQICLETFRAQSRDYSTTDNPPVLHRKETFVTPDYPHYDRFCWLTQQEETLGLLDQSRGIGFQQAWERRLRDRGLEIHDHALACAIQTGAKPTQAKPKIERHRAAIARVTASKPVRLAVEAGLFPPDTTYFDYGCGHGADIEYIQRLDHTSSGWDPHYRPDTEPVTADVVNLGYVINVIEDTAERREALINAWGLAQKVLIVAAQVLIERSHPWSDCLWRRHHHQPQHLPEILRAGRTQSLYRPGARR
jgi:hypothetical protein